LFEAINIEFWYVVSEYNPFAKPITVKSPVVLTLSKFAAYTADDSQEILEEVGVLNFKSYS
jgi:hypothetical protein